jgi:acetyl-CoA C-acetyltransferase
MGLRVAIVGYGQTRFEWDAEKTREEMVFEAARKALEDAGIDREDVCTVISASTDFLDGRTISNCMLIGATGAYLKDESKAEEDGMLAALYALERLLSGTHEIALVTAHTVSWTFNPHQVSVYMLDPLFDRQNRYLYDISIAAIQAKLYMNRYDVSEEQIGMVSVKNFRNAAMNPFAYMKLPDITLDEILNSKVYAEPIRELTMAPVCDGACSVVLATEEKVREITDNPVWIEGVGNCADVYIRDRDLSRLNSLQVAARKAYKMAGVTDPYREIDVVELTERFAHQELMAYEALGLCREGKAKNLIEAGLTEIYGDIPVNPSGGAMAGDAICATGLLRLIEAAKQIRGEAGRYQIDGAEKAVAHAQWGLAAQKNVVFVLGGEV